MKKTHLFSISPMFLSLQWLSVSPNPEVSQISLSLRCYIQMDLVSPLAEETYEHVTSLKSYFGI